MPTDTATPAAAPAPESDRHLEITITIHMRVPPPPPQPAAARAAGTTPFGAERLDTLLREKLARAIFDGAPTAGCDCAICTARRQAQRPI